MANLCSFLMKVCGEHDNIEKFYNAMMQNGTIYMGRGADASIDYDDENGTAQIDGCCKWSVVSALIDNAISMRTNPERWYWDNIPNKDELEFITLWEACKRWNLIMEVYSEECGCCFQEHFRCDKGDIIYEECIDWEEYFIDDYETKEEAEEDLEITITDKEWAIGLKEGCFSRGGFGSWDFEI